MRARHGSDDRGRAGGFVAIEWVAAVALLLLPVVMLAATLPVWAERRHAAVVAAREAARQLANDWPVSDRARAARVAGEVLADHDVRPGDVRVHVRSAGAFRGDRVVVEVEIAMPAISVAGVNAGAWRYTARAVRRIDDFRTR